MEEATKITEDWKHIKRLKRISIKTEPTDNNQCTAEAIEESQEPISCSLRGSGEHTKPNKFPAQESCKKPQEPILHLIGGSRELVSTPRSSGEHSKATLISGSERNHKETRATGASFNSKKPWGAYHDHIKSKLMKELQGSSNHSQLFI